MNSIDKVKLKIGIHGLTSCYGCQLQLACLDEIIKVTDRFNVEFWSMVSSDGEINSVDIAFVEGSVTTDNDLQELKEIREKSGILVAVGSCAVHGGVQGMIYGESYQDVYTETYGNYQIDFNADIARPLKEFVTVDYDMPGCPPEDYEMLYYLATFAIGSYPEIKDFPVCAECRRKGFPCILIEQGKPCLGPVIVAGCEARCPGHNVACFGCRGPIPFDISWFDSVARTFRDVGFSKDAIKKRVGIFGKQYPKLDELIEKVFENED